MNKLEQRNSEVDLSRREFMARYGLGAGMVLMSLGSVGFFNIAAKDEAIIKELDKNYGKRHKRMDVFEAKRVVEKNKNNLINRENVSKNNELIQAEKILKEEDEYMTIYNKQARESGLKIKKEVSAGALAGGMMIGYLGELCNAQLNSSDRS